LLTQRKFALYLVSREVDYHFTVKNNQPTLREDIALFSRAGENLILLTIPRPIMAASKPEKSGQPPHSTRTWISIMSAKPL
jgi:hypothetical protein